MSVAPGHRTGAPSGASAERPLPGRPPRRNRLASGRPAAGAPRSVAQLLWEWQNPHATPWRRAFAYGWQRRGRHWRTIVLVALALLAGGTLSFARQEPLDAFALQARLHGVEQQLRAREGELEYARMEMARMNDVIRLSARHRIPADMARDIYDIALSEGIDPALAFALVSVESGFRPSVISSAGAVGLAQLMPRTAAFMQPGVSYAEMFDRPTNLRIGFRYLRMLTEHYHGDIQLALLAYNRGPTRVDSIRRANGDPRNGYERAVLGRR